MFCEWSSVNGGCEMIPVFLYVVDSKAGLLIQEINNYDYGL